MKLILLGTAGGPTPKRRRAAPSQVILHDGAAHVVDCGNGAGRQLALAGVAPSAVRHVHVTHHHSDHVADLVTLPVLLWASGLEHELTLHGPPPIHEAVEAGLRAVTTDLETREDDEGRPPLRELLRVHELQGAGIVLDQGGLLVRCAAVDHPPLEHALAYRFDGEGRSIVVSGDTAPCAGLIELARGADVLVHEVLLASESELAAWLGRPPSHPLVQHVLRSHSPFESLGRIAAESQVRKLVLSHFVPGDAEVDHDRVLRAIRRDFGGEVIFGEDLLEVQA